MFTVHFTVTVNSPLQDNESVFVTGSHGVLGEWEPNRALRLTKNENRQWTGTASMGVETVKFRYFIGYYLESEANQPTLIISKWETHLAPRYVMPAVEASKTRVCRANVNDVFGFNGGREMLSDGWLLNDDHNQIVLMLSGEAFKFYKSRHKHDEYRVKVVPLDLRNKQD
ncbi:Protein T05H10.7 b, partial [Aphelenchoides avenae]